MPRWWTTSVRASDRQDIAPAVAGAAHRCAVCAPAEGPVAPVAAVPVVGTAAAADGDAAATRPPVTRAPVARTATAARRAARLIRPGLVRCNELPSMGGRLPRAAARLAGFVT